MLLVEHGVYTAVSLFGRLLEKITCHAEMVVQLAVQFVGGGDHDQRRVLHRGLLQLLACVAVDGNAHAAALRVPAHAHLSRARLHRMCERQGASRRLSLLRTPKLIAPQFFSNRSILRIGCRDRGDADGLADSMELMVTGDRRMELTNQSVKTR